MQPDQVRQDAQCQANHDVHVAAIRLMDQAIALLSESASLMATHRPEQRRPCEHQIIPGQLVVLEQP